MTTRRLRNTNNRTRKCRPSQKQLKVFCKEHANTFNQFEEEYEKTFTKSLKEENRNIEHELIKMFKTPFTPSKYKTQND